MTIDRLNTATSLLEKQAALGQTLTYREFANALGICSPPIIKTCTDLLETLMAQDCHLNQPILAALVVQQGRSRIPRLGFYQTLSSLNLYNGQPEGDEALQWHQNEIMKLKKHYQVSTTHKV